MRLLWGRHVRLYSCCFAGRATSRSGGVPGWLWSFSSNQILPKTATAGPCVGNVAAPPAWGKEQLHSAGRQDYLGWRHGAWPDLPTGIPGHCCPPAVSPQQPQWLSHGGGVLSYTLWWALKASNIFSKKTHIGEKRLLKHLQALHTVVFLSI